MARLQFGRYKFAIFAIMVAVAVIVSSGAAILGTVNNSGTSEMIGPPGWRTLNVVSGSMTVNAKGLTVVGCCVPPGASNAVLKGNFTATYNGAEVA